MNNDITLIRKPNAQNVSILHHRVQIEEKFQYD